MPTKDFKPTLYATLGFPGSGKTYFSERFAKDNNLFHLNSDNVRLRIIENPQYTPEEHAVVFKALDYIAETLLSQGISVIYDANFNKVVHRKKLQQIADKTNSNYVLLYFKTPLELALERLKQRRKITSKEQLQFYRPISNDVLYKLRDEIEEPTPRESYVAIDGRLPFEEQKNNLAKYIDF